MTLLLDDQRGLPGAADLLAFESQLWNALQEMACHSDAVIRKRAAYCLQALVSSERFTVWRGEHEQHEHFPKEHGTSATSKGGRKQNVSSSSSSSSAKSKKAGGGSLQQPSSSTTNGGCRHWSSDWLAAYHQCEGIGSTHTLQQIWPLLDTLFLHMVQAMEIGYHPVGFPAPESSPAGPLEAEERRGASYRAGLAFSWPRALLRLLLGNSLPGITQSGHTSCAEWTAAPPGGGNDCKLGPVGIAPCSG